MPGAYYSLRDARVLPGTWALALLIAAGCASEAEIIADSPAAPQSRESSVVWSETFEAGSLKKWREVSLSGNTDYRICEPEGNPCLCAMSDASASVLLRELHFNPYNAPWIKWSWRVDELIESEDLSEKSGSDATARIYVYFDDEGFLWDKQSLNYVWSSEIPEGTILTSAFSSKAKIIVAESGDDHLGQWRTVERNIVDDYRRAFGKEPPSAVALGIMSDADNTRSRARAYFDDLNISRLPQEKAGSSLEASAEAADAALPDKADQAPDKSAP